MKDKLRRVGYILFGFGCALLIEKIVNYGFAFTYPPILDHGLYGSVAIILAFIILTGGEKRD